MFLFFQRDIFIWLPLREACLFTGPKGWMVILMIGEGWGAFDLLSKKKKLIAVVERKKNIINFPFLYIFSVYLKIIITVYVEVFK